MCNYIKANNEKCKLAPKKEVCGKHINKIQKIEPENVSQIIVATEEISEIEVDMSPRATQATDIEQTIECEKISEKTVAAVDASVELVETLYEASESQVEQKLNKPVEVERENIESDFESEVDYESDDESYVPAKIFTSCKFLIAEYESDDEFEDDEGYESDIDPINIKEPIDKRESDKYDLIDAKSELYAYAGVNQDSINTEIKAEWVAAKQDRLDELEAQRNHREELILAYQNTVSESESGSESESKSLQYKGEIDLGKVFSDDEIYAMRSNMYYKLIILLGKDFYYKYYGEIVFAFKNDPTIDDNQSVFMLREINKLYHDSWSEMDERTLVMTINRKMYPSYFNQELLGFKWCRIKKLAKEFKPTDYAAWKKERIAIDRKEKAIESISAEKERYSIYQFLLQYKSYGDIKISDFYSNYVEFCGKKYDVLKNTVFGKKINLHGITTKRTNKYGKIYQISPEAIESWIASYVA